MIHGNECQIKDIKQYLSFTSIAQRLIEFLTFHVSLCSDTVRHWCDAYFFTIIIKINRHCKITKRIDGLVFGHFMIARLDWNDFNQSNNQLSSFIEEAPLRRLILILFQEKRKSGSMNEDKKLK